MNYIWNTIVIGGGAAGFFAAVNIYNNDSESPVLILERSQQLLNKVKISGGGRCNVTHSCFDPAALVKHYPRGEKTLRGPFSRFQPKDTIAWFQERGVSLHTEEDGRMFPTTNDSQTIIDCLLGEAERKGVEIQVGVTVNHVEKQNDLFILSTSKGEFNCHNLILATGSQPKGHAIAKNFGHTIIPPVPSLFTFNVPDSPLLDLPGVSVNPVTIRAECTSYKQTGPVLLTHWGFSGPAVLKLSAWAARDLHACQYKTSITINWTGEMSREEVKSCIIEHKNANKNRVVRSDPLFGLPGRLWDRLLACEHFAESLRWTNLSNRNIEILAEKMQQDKYRLDGKTTYKKEFVTAGGISLNEVNFQTMESKICPGLYFVGEILDIDGVTGGFNFQNAWTTGFIASQSLRFHS